MTENEFASHAQAILGALSDDTPPEDLTYHAEAAGMLAADIVRRLRVLATHASPVVREGVEIGLSAVTDDPHPSGCHTSAPGSRDCYSDGHSSCYTCSRRVDRDEQVWRDGGIVVPPRKL